MKRVGKVKGFKPFSYECFDGCGNICFEGNSKDIKFLMYDLERLLTVQLKTSDTERKKLKLAAEESKGILRAEVRLTKPGAISAYTDESLTTSQIAELSKKSAEIFMDVFAAIIPFGDFYKLDKAIEIVRKEVKDNTLKRRMLHLLTLIPEKRSLLLAQKALNFRRLDEVMQSFAEIDLSPVTLSRRHEVKHLENLYTHLQK